MAYFTGKCLLCIILCCSIGFFSCENIDRTRKCDFESACPDLEWPPSNGDYNWLIRQGSTQSELTGPDADHTTGYGQYVYTESSRGMMGDVASLVTTRLQSISQLYCVRFWYHMYGVDIDRLNVFYSTITQDMNTMTIFTVGGNQGNKWNQVRKNINTTVGLPFVVTFQAIKGKWYRADIALDDILLAPFSCDDLGEWETWSAWSSCTLPCGGGTQARFRHCSSNKCQGDGDSTQVIECNNNKCPTGDAVWKCDFESLCFDFSPSILNVRGYTWMLRMGKTETIETGPSSDHTTGKGFYMLADASRVPPGEKADYISTPVQSTEPWYCLSMWYHMYGRHVNHLAVYSIQNNTKEMLFNKKGNLGDQWNHFTRPFSMRVGVDFMIQLRATRGQGDQGDIAIDDIVVTLGKCKQENGGNNGDKISQWKQWSQCGGATCGKGTRTRVRRCRQEPCDHKELRQVERCDLPRQCPPTRVACGRTSPQLIIGGRESEEGKWPWQVGLYIRRSDVLGASFALFCGASILTERFILTAAHCLVQQSKGGLVPINIHSTMAIMGSIHMLVGGTRHTIKRLIPHPGFNFSSAMNDIALMELNSAITYNRKIRPICLPTLPRRLGNRCYVTGWGKIGPYSLSPGTHTLKETQQTIQSEQWCEWKYQGQSGTTFQRNSHFCAGPSIETDVTGLGDSGGPFSCQEDDGYHVQGVVSIGNPIDGRPSAYTDIYRFLPWIKNILYK